MILKLKAFQKQSNFYPGRPLKPNSIYPRYLFLILLNLLIGTAFINGRSIDSLKSELNLNRSKLERSRTLLALGLALKDSSLDLAKKRMLQAESLAHEIQEPLLEASAAWEMGVLLLDAKEDSLAFLKLSDARALYLKNDEVMLAARVSIAKAKAYEKLRDFRNVARELESIYSDVDSLGDAKTAGYVHNFLGLTLWKLGHLASAEQHFLISLDNFKKVNLPKRRALVYNNLGVIYFNWGRYEEALTSYRMASAIHDSVGNYNKKVILMANIGATYLKLGDIAKARQTLLEALQISENDQYERGIINAYHWLARVEYDSGKFGLATSYNEIALEYYRENREYGGQIKILIELGRIYTANLEYNRGELILREAAALAKDVGDILEEARAEHMLGYNCLLQGKYMEAESALNKALKHAREQFYREVEMNTLHDLATLKYLMHATSEGQAIERRSASMRDSLFNSDLLRKISELQVRFDLEQRDRQIEHLHENAELQAIELQRERTRQTMLLSGMFVLSILVITLVWSFNKLKRNRDVVKDQHNRLIQMNAKLQASIDDQHRLFRIISHDLRGPMGTMNELLDLIVKGKVSAGASKEILATASETANSLYRLIENLFNWARLQSGELKLQQEYLELSNLIKMNTDLMKSNLEQKELKLVIDIQHGLPVYVDRDMTAAIIRNLLSNSVKFSHPGGIISVRTRDKSSEGFVEIEIQDTGIGIPTEALPDIFDPNKSLRRKGTRNENTSGLGLPLVKDFVGLHQGSIRIESEEGKGSTFTFTLPTGPQERGQS
jgi:signal transduction histidine kinase/Tfp pilus assembly protein PilF